MPDRSEAEQLNAIAIPPAETRRDWVTFISFVSINILHFPIQRVISGTFKETILGKVFNIYWSYKVSPTFLTRKV